MDTVNQQAGENRQPYGDEIDLVELCAKIWRGKWKIVVSTLACLSLAIIYLYITPKSYQLETLLAPPLAVDLEPIQPAQLEAPHQLERLNTVEVFELVKGYLQSEDSRLNFWRKHKNGSISSELTQGQEEEFLGFHKKLALSQGKKETAVKLLFDTVDPDTGARMLREFLEYVDKQVVSELVTRMERTLRVLKE